MSSETVGDPCELPPAGWKCTRPSGHDGPCAASPETEEDVRERLAREKRYHELADEEVSEAYETGVKEGRAWQARNLAGGMVAAMTGILIEECAMTQVQAADYLIELLEQMKAKMPGVWKKMDAKVAEVLHEEQVEAAVREHTQTKPPPKGAS